MCNGRVPPKKRVFRTDLPEAERAVSARLREIRDFLRLSQAEFASQVGLTRASLASYEDGRAPLRLKPGLTICRQFIVREKWLATGGGKPYRRTSAGMLTRPLRFGEIPTRVFVNVQSKVALDATALDAPYAEGFKNHIAQEFDLLDDPSRLLPNIEITPGDNVSMFQNLLDYAVSFFGELLSEEDRKSFLLDLTRAARAVYHEFGLVEKGFSESKHFFSEALETIAHLRKHEFYAYAVVPLTREEFEARQKKPKEVLTWTSEICKPSAVMPPEYTMEQLLDDVRKLTSPAGMKTKLAKHLGVPQSRVSEWIGGKYEPSGEVTLKLWHWVKTEQEPKQKTPGRVTSTAKGN